MGAGSPTLSPERSDIPKAASFGRPDESSDDKSSRRRLAAVEKSERLVVDMRRARRTVRGHEGTFLLRAARTFRRQSPSASGHPIAESRRRIIGLAATMRHSIRSGWSRRAE